ncbi:antitoxin Xre/MbcA/ParS toxin-binding domain-containing protein [Sphingomonas soli]|uniref:antitoxin Xre/MbcA/ParS toxin-binding domain-containing protein n=1 Tax=Sphingomonas soli TaxID=266127 RepID=UPI00082B380D|nr:antitoxin Xre/MbcA/ParS toxin-binding domain-containing protein [Sphingomonas soli]
MSDATPADQGSAAEPPASDAKPQFKRFRKRFDTVRLSPEAATRQGRVATSAFLALKGRDAMIAFLNTHDDSLGGRPIDLAVESDAGLAAVEQALAARAAG